MTTSKPPYDPVKTVEAMFMGSVARIAYVMKDPVNFAPATRAVLAETAKKFQDALDDCELQILDAKWYLEDQLRINKARREAKAREDSAASAKRKREETQDAQDKTQTQEGESAPKRVKTQEPEEPLQPPPKPQQNPQQTSPGQKPPPQPQPAATSKPTAQAAPSAPEKSATVKPPDKPKVAVVPGAKAPQPQAPPAVKQQAKPKQTEPAPVPERTMTQTTTDEFPKPTPQDTPADGSEAFNFESMFGEPSADMMDSSGNDMTFDLDDLSGDSYVQDNSLNSLLPGLESYANQAGDDSTFTMSGTTMNGLPTGNDLSTMGAQTDTVPNTQQQPQANDFSLPQLGPNEFDDFLNANDMSFDDPINLDGDGMLNMDNMENVDMNMDFDSMFS
ncbi:hypothetical protein H2200_011172 [Cladophialophora chaetospira]|uniref:Uncharacterized protein n=1 Tax=Cladophialophora chaetospira TaxID=386627 RepID=A0AA38X052_9EURO|nr:hypothetical protein H2200_011172 [Cladophialophora chaetospira]